MALLVAVTPANAGTTGTLEAPVAVASSDTISGNDILAGAVLRVINGSGGSINVTFTDPGHTAAGNTGTQAAAPVAAGATRKWTLTPAFIDPATNVATVTYSAITTVTCELIRTP